MSERMRFKKFDEKGNALKPPKTYLDTRKYIEIDDEDTYSVVFSKSEQWCLDCFSEYMYFVERTNRKLNKSEKYLTQKKEFLEKNQDAFDLFVKENKITVALKNDMTVFELIDFLEKNKKEEKKEDKKDKKEEEKKEVLAINKEKKL